MQNHLSLRILLVLCGLLAISVGGLLLLTPASLHAANGIELGGDSSLLSEVRAPGGALLALGLLMWMGVVVRSVTFAAATMAATVYLSYGLARLVSLSLDGRPSDGIVAAAVIELVLGSATVFALWRGRRSMRQSFLEQSSECSGNFQAMGGN